MRIDANSHVPIFQQIIAAVHGALAAGVFKPAEPLPSVRALALELAVNPNTVQRAYQELERQGLIAARRGRGMFVSERGVKSARTRAEAAVQGAFAQGVAIGQNAGLDGERIHALYRQATGDCAASLREDDS